MANEINSLSATDASNTARFPENQAPSSLNDGLRALEGMLARADKDRNGSLVSTGSSSAYALAINSTNSAPYDGMTITFEANHASTGATTIAITPSGGSVYTTRSIVWPDATALAAGDIASGAKVTIRYDNDNTRWQLCTVSVPVVAATESVAGKVELATDAETATGTDTARAVTPANVKSAYVKQGTHTIWVPAGAMRPTTSNGCAALAATETTAGRPDLIGFAFDASNDEHAQFQIAFPKSWNEGTVTFQVWWWSTAADTDGVAWGLQGVACADGDTADVAYGTPVVVTDSAQSTSEDVYVTSVSSAVTIDGTPAAGDICFFRIFRDVSDAADTAAEDCILLGVKIFFTINSSDDA